jgi:hypothetical protein
MSRQDELYCQMKAEIARIRTATDHLTKYAYDMKRLADSYQYAKDKAEEEGHDYRWEGGGNY